MPYLIVRLIHIVFMATWIGSLLFLSGDIRRTLAEPSAHLPLLRARMNRATRIAGASGLMTLVTGVALILLLGGFGAVPPAIHLGLLTSLAMLGVGGGLIGRNARTIEAGLEKGESPASLLPAAEKLALGARIFHSLWLATLALMVFRALSVG